VTTSLPELLRRWEKQELGDGVAEEHRSFASAGRIDYRPVLFLHGLGGSPADFREFGEFLSRRGHATLCPLLPGHGRSPEELASVRFDDLVRHVTQSFDSLEAGALWPIVIGQSLGAVLGIRLVTRRRTSHFVALAPALRPFVGARALALLPLAVAQPALARDTMRWQMEARRGIVETRRSVASVMCPLFVLHSRDDASVSVKGAQDLYEGAATEIKQRSILEGDVHVLSTAPDRVAAIFEPVAEWIRVTPPGVGIRNLGRHHADA
jgi:carboxylesterase